MGESELNRVCLGIHRAIVDGEVYCVHPPTFDNLCEADELYQCVLDEAYLEGILSDTEILGLLCQLNLWDEAKQNALDKLPGDILALKKAMLKAAFRSDDKAKLRGEVRKAEEQLNSLWALRHSMDYLSCEGLARGERGRLLLQRGLRVEADDNLIDNISRSLLLSRPGERDIRAIARSERWRAMWAAQGVRSIFQGGENTPLTEEQRHLVNWTLLYEKILDHPNRPGDDVLADDDLLDGWLAEQSGGSKSSPTIANEKIRNAQEVFIFAQTQEDANRIYAMNDRQAQEKVQSRIKTVKERGVVAEADLPDVRRDAKMKAVAAMRKK